jgi:hypothetical protein
MVCKLYTLLKEVSKFIRFWLRFYQSLDRVELVLTSNNIYNVLTMAFIQAMFLHNLLISSRIDLLSKYLFTLIQCYHKLWK